MAPEIVKCQIRDFCTMNGITLETKQNKVFCRESRNLIWSRKKKKIIFQNSLPQVCTNVGLEMEFMLYFGQKNQNITPGYLTETNANLL